MSIITNAFHVFWFERERHAGCMRTRLLSPLSSARTRAYRCVLRHWVATQNASSPGIDYSYTYSVCLLNARRRRHVAKNHAGQPRQTLENMAVNIVSH
jgi:hypothetical protein